MVVSLKITLFNLKKQKDDDAEINGHREICLWLKFNLIFALHDV